MKNFRSSLFFILGCMIFAVHEAYSIKGFEGGLVWHLTQFISILLYLIAGMYFGMWLRDYGTVTKFYRNANGINVIGQGFNYYDFVNIVAVSLLGILLYVFSLHFLETVI